MLSVARRLADRWPDVELVLLDRADLVTFERLWAFRAIGWQARAVMADALQWMEEPGLLVRPRDREPLPPPPGRARAPPPARSRSPPRPSLRRHRTAAQRLRPRRDEAAGADRRQCRDAARCSPPVSGPASRGGNSQSSGRRARRASSSSGASGPSPTPSRPSTEEPRLDARRHRHRRRTIGIGGGDRAGAAGPQSGDRRTERVPAAEGLRRVRLRREPRAARPAGDRRRVQGEGRARDRARRALRRGLRRDRRHASRPRLAIRSGDRPRRARPAAARTGEGGGRDRPPALARHGDRQGG